MCWVDTAHEFLAREVAAQIGGEQLDEALVFVDRQGRGCGG
jgi:hypothetical protein